MLLKLTLLVLVTCVTSIKVHNLFDAYAGADGEMDKKEFNEFWFHFDNNDDGNVTKLEFDVNWQMADFDDPERSPLFFLEMDRVPDEVLNEADFAHLFSLFEGSDDDSLLSWDEFHRTWESLFKV